MFYTKPTLTKWLVMWDELRTGNWSNSVYQCHELRSHRSQFPNRKGELTRSDILKIFRLEKFWKFLIHVQIFVHSAKILNAFGIQPSMFMKMLDFKWIQPRKFPSEFINIYISGSPQFLILNRLLFFQAIYLTRIQYHHILYSEAVWCWSIQSKHASFQNSNVCWQIQFSATIGTQDSFSIYNLYC